jgi:hypothetical protein
MTSIVVGTNVFVECDTPLVIDGVPAIQISRDDGMLELSVEVSAPPARHPVRVSENAAVSADTTVSARRESVDVFVSGEPIVRAQRVGGVTHLRLDLRPVGLFIYSDDEALHLGASVLTGNTIRAGINLSTGGMNLADPGPEGS